MTALLRRHHVPVEQVVLANGLAVVVSPDPSLGFVVVDTWHATGSMDDGPGRSGLAHVAEHVCVGDAPGKGHTTERNATTSFERTNFVDVGPPRELPAMLDAAAERPARAAGCDNATLARHAAVVRQEIDQREDLAHFGSGLRRSLRLLFGTAHPFGRPALGDLADLDRLSAADVAAFVRRGYGAANTVVSVVGSVDLDRVVAEAEQRLGALPAGSIPRRPPCLPAPVGAREDVEEGQATALLRMSFVLPSDTGRPASAADVLVAGLAGAPWAVFGTDFVARHGVLSCSADLVPCHAGPSVGVLRFAVAEGVDPVDVELAVRDRLAAVADAGLGEVVHAAAVARHRKQHLALLSGARSRAETLCRRRSWFGDAEPDADVPDDVAPLEVAAAARCADTVAVVTFHAGATEEPAWIL